MTVEAVTDIAREALYLIIKCSAPLLLISLTVGLIVSVFQTATSIQEQTLTFVPKILCVFLGMMVMGHWILNQIVAYMNELWSNFSLYIR